MSRRRGEFEHRTSIFEGAYRAWSHLGGINPNDLKEKNLEDLDPLIHPLKNDNRLNVNIKSNYVEKEYYYEPLPRSGLAHPFVQAILSPWLGPDADEEAIQLGLTTLRTWWQHRRKGESGSARTALGSEKMKGVVTGYTRHFFNLAHCLVTNDGEQPPRTHIKELNAREKLLKKQICGKKEKNQKDTVLAAPAPPLATDDEHDNDVNNDDDVVNSVDIDHVPRRVSMGKQYNSAPNYFDKSRTNFLANNNATTNSDNNGHQQQTSKDYTKSLNKSALERMHELQREQLKKNVKEMSNNRHSHFGKNNDNNSNNKNYHYNSNDSNHNEVKHASIHKSYNAQSQPPLLTQPIYGDPRKTPVVFVSETGDIQIAMSIIGITSSHCVKIIETVLRGCHGNKSPIKGLLDAAADRDLNAVLVKIDRSSNAKRIAFDAARNLSMVGYTASPMEMDIVDLQQRRNRGIEREKLDLSMLNAAFDVVANTNSSDVFDWKSPCSCPDNGVLREDCAR